MKTEPVTAAEGKSSQEISEEQESSNNTIEKEPDASKDVPVQKKRKRCWTCNAKLELAQRELGNCRCSKYCYVKVLLIKEQVGYFFWWDILTGCLNCVLFSLRVEQLSNFDNIRVFLFVSPLKTSLMGIGEGRGHLIVPRPFQGHHRYIMWQSHDRHRKIQCTGIKFLMIDYEGPT